MTLLDKLDFLNIPTFGTISGTLLACLLLKNCPNSTQNTLELIGYTGLLLSLGMNLYRHEEVETYLHGFTSGLTITAAVSVPFLLKI